MPADLDTYAAKAETFLSELDLEYHLHFSGQKATYEVEPIYARHAELFAREAVDELRAAAERASGDGARRVRYLLELAVGGYLGRATAAQDAEIAAREARLEVEGPGGTIPYRMAPVVQANEPDATRRRRLDEARLGLLEEHLGPLHAEALEISHRLVRELGWRSYRDAWAELRGLDLDALGSETQRFLAATDDAYEPIVEPELVGALGFGFAEVHRADLARFFRAPALDRRFSEERLLPAFAETVAGLGLSLDSQPNIRLDTQQRPTKTARAYCAPVRVPGEVYLVVPRVGGRDDYAALFHEGGHAQHYANVDPGLPVEFRYLGDNSVTESYAFLLEHLTDDREWLVRLGNGGATTIEAEDGDVDAVVSHARAVKLFFLRRYVAKLAYELELHGADADLAAMPDRYAELIGEATRFEWTSRTWLSDVDDAFYVAAYLRAWALEAHWRRALRERFGALWFASPEAGMWLRGLWREGQRRDAGELLAEVVGEELRFDALSAEFSA